MAGFSGFGIRFVLEVLASVVGHARACLLDGTFPLQVSIGPDGPVRTESEGHLSGDGRVGPPRRTARAPGRAGRLARPPRSPFPYMRAPAPRRRGGLSEPAGQSGSPQVTMGEMVDLTPIRSGRLIFSPFLSILPPLRVRPVDPLRPIPLHFALSMLESLITSRRAIRC